MNTFPTQLDNIFLSKDRAVTGLLFILPPKYFWEGAERMSLQKQEGEALLGNGNPGPQGLNPCFVKAILIQYNSCARKIPSQLSRADERISSFRIPKSIGVQPLSMTKNKSNSPHVWR